MGDPKPYADQTGPHIEDIEAQNKPFGPPRDGCARRLSDVFFASMIPKVNRYIRGRLLRSEGFEVIEAATGSAALKLAAEKHPSLILLDIQLPDINGFAVCRRLKSNPKTSLRFRCCTSPASANWTDEYPEALESGAEAYLQEPVEPVDLGLGGSSVDPRHLRRSSSKEDRKGCRRHPGEHRPKRCICWTRATDTPM